MQDQALVLSRSTRVVEGKTNGRAYDRIDLLTSQKPQKMLGPTKQTQCKICTLIHAGTFGSNHQNRKSVPVTNIL